MADSEAHNLKVKDSGGDGRAVMLIHGWPLSSEAWSEQTQALRDGGYRVLAYDRRGFGDSDPGDSYGYDVLADDLANVIDQLELHDVTLVGFSMGGGEVARYIGRHGTDKLRSVVFAAAVPPYLRTTSGNPDGPLDDDTAEQMKAGLAKDRDAFFKGFVNDFYSVGDELLATEQQVADALALCAKSDPGAAEACRNSFSITDFREDLPGVDVPALIIHGDSDAIVPFEGSGQLTHEAIDGSELVLIEGAPHGLNVTHAQEFNDALLAFLKK